MDHRAVDLSDLARRARLAGELGRLRAALRLPLAVSPLAVWFIARSNEPANCAAVAALVSSLLTLFRWRGHDEGQSARTGLICGCLADVGFTFISTLAERFHCEQSAAAACVALVGLASAHLVLLFLPIHEQSPIDCRLVRGALIAGLMAGLSISMCCVGGGASTLVITGAATLCGAGTRIAALRLRRA